MLQKITVNFAGKVHYDEMSGKKYLVAPMVMLTEGVHEGTGGPLLYPKEEISKTPQVWNHKPVIVYHPQAADGGGISACDPIILTNRQIGLIMNTRVGKIKVNNKMIPALKAEAWLDEERMNKIDERIAQAIEKNETMELSTGLFTDNESVEDGDWNGEKYDAIARNYRPDHLALLPDLKGACSIEDGAGFLRLNAKPDKIHVTNNAMSHGNVRSLLNSWLQDKDEDVWVEDVYDVFFIFMKDGKLFKGIYSIVDNAIQVESTFEEVVRVTEYRTKNGEFVGNESSIIKRKELTMLKKEIVDNLITSNSNSWVENDRETLMAMDDAVLEKMQASEKLAAEKAVENAVEKYRKDEAAKNEAAKKKAADEKVAAEAIKNEKSKTVDDYISDAPQEIQNVLRSALATNNTIKETLVKRLLDNVKNQFTEEQLRSKDNDELKQLVALTANVEDEDTSLADYSALGIESTVTKEQPMLMQAVVGQDTK